MKEGGGGLLMVRSSDKVNGDKIRLSEMKTVMVKGWLMVSSGFSGSKGNEDKRWLMVSSGNGEEGDGEDKRWLIEGCG